MMESRSKAKVVLLAGGGSGGHVSPALAIAERINEQSSDSRVLFACSQRPVDAMMLERAGADFRALAAKPFTAHPLHAPGFFFSFLRSRIQCAKMIDREGVDVVVAVGGFVAAPAVAAAKKCGRHVVLVNLDDPPGRANRWIAKRADLILSAVPCDAWSNRSIDISGVPLRREVIADRSQEDCRSALGLDPDLRVLLVTGASQGAGSINAVLPRIVRSCEPQFRGWQVLHLSGAREESSVRAAYEGVASPVTVLPFLHEMGLAWGAADLAISRAGANSVAEAAANAVPAIFLPYPYHADDHQRRNAAPLESIGGAIILADLVDPARNLDSLTPALTDLMQSEEKLGAMRQALRAHHPADAAARMAQRILDLA